MICPAPLHWTHFFIPSTVGAPLPLQSLQATRLVTTSSFSTPLAASSKEMLKQKWREIAGNLGFDAFTCLSFTTPKEMINGWLAKDSYATVARLRFEIERVELREAVEYLDALVPESSVEVVEEYKEVVVYQQYMPLVLPAKQSHKLEIQNPNEFLIKLFNKKYSASLDVSKTKENSVQLPQSQKSLDRPKNVLEIKAPEPNPVAVSEPVATHKNDVEIKTAPKNEVKVKQEPKKLLIQAPKISLNNSTRIPEKKEKELRERNIELLVKPKQTKDLHKSTSQTNKSGDEKQSNKAVPEKSGQVKILKILKNPKFQSKETTKDKNFYTQCLSNISKVSEQFISDGINNSSVDKPFLYYVKKGDAGEHIKLKKVIESTSQRDNDPKTITFSHSRVILPEKKYNELGYYNASTVKLKGDRIAEVLWYGNVRPLAPQEVEVVKQILLNKVLNRNDILVQAPKQFAKHTNTPGIKDFIRMVCSHNVGTLVRLSTDKDGYDYWSNCKNRTVFFTTQDSTLQTATMSVEQDSEDRHKSIITIKTGKTILKQITLWSGEELLENKGDWVDFVAKVHQSTSSNNDCTIIQSWNGVEYAGVFKTLLDVYRIMSTHKEMNAKNSIYYPQVDKMILQYREDRMGLVINEKELQLCYEISEEIIKRFTNIKKCIEPEVDELKKSTELKSTDKIELISRTDQERIESKANVASLQLEPIPPTSSKPQKMVWQQVAPKVKKMGAATRKSDWSVPQPQPVVELPNKLDKLQVTIDSAKSSSFIESLKSKFDFGIQSTEEKYLKEFYNNEFYKIKIKAVEYLRKKVNNDVPGDFWYYNIKPEKIHRGYVFVPSTSDLDNDKNIIPFIHTRIKLPGRKDNNMGYYNANKVNLKSDRIGEIFVNEENQALNNNEIGYLKDLLSTKVLNRNDIFAQAPINPTIQDFQQMWLFQEDYSNNVGAIVRLSTAREGNAYWTTTGRDFSYMDKDKKLVKVTMDIKHAVEDKQKSTMTIKKNGDVIKTMTIWNGENLLNNKGDWVDFVAKVHESTRDNNDSIIIQSWNGVKYAGVFKTLLDTYRIMSAQKDSSEHKLLYYTHPMRMIDQYREDRMNLVADPMELRICCEKSFEIFDRLANSKRK
jgi:hypothetical protein